MSKRLLPNHVPYTARQWRSRKRRQLRAALEAMDPLTFGCAFTPREAYENIGIALGALRVAKAAMRGNWKP